MLLSILVAAGPDGAPIEAIAGAYWNQTQPVSWKIALRVSASHLSAQLPDGWNVDVSDGRFRLVPGDGFVDIWRVEDCVQDPSLEVASWLRSGPAFPGVKDVDIVDAAALRLEPLIAQLRERVVAQQPVRSDPGATSTAPDQVRWIRSLRRAIVLGLPDEHSQVARAIARDQVTKNHVVIGDRRLLLPLGPFAMTFPELRKEIQLEQGVVEPGSAARAFRIVADTLAVQATYRPQRLAISNAHELDTKSLKLISFLIDQGRLTDFSLIVCADQSYRDIRWLDFVNRSITAGCELVQLPAS